MPHAPPFQLSEGAAARLPILLSVPHAGRCYDPALLASVRIGRDVLHILEDPLVDALIEPARSLGAAAIVANVPRVLIDLNRSLDDLDGTMIAPPGESAVSRRASVGLGLIPSRLAGHGAIWRALLPIAEVRRRIEQVHAPYHQAVEATLAALRKRFGIAVLLDCHSMPARAAPAAGVVLGDRHGSSAGGWLIDAAQRACREAGIVVARNDPYAGGEIAARHGRPAQGSHALQIELDRGLYLTPDGRRAGSGFARTARLLAEIVRTVADAALSDTLPLAAE